MRAERIVLIGQAPAKAGEEPRHALIGGKTGARLQFMTGCTTMRDYVQRFERWNLLAEFPGRAGKGHAFPLALARDRAAALRPALAGRTVVFVGLAVARAFGDRDADPYIHKLYREGFDGASIPHPSPINRYWNEVENWKRVRRFFDELLGRTTLVG